MPIFLQPSSRPLVAGAKLVFVFFMMFVLSCPGQAQEPLAPAPLSTDSSGELKEQVRELRTLVEQLQKQVSDLQARVPTTQFIEKVGNPPSAQVSAPAPPAEEKAQDRGDTLQTAATSASSKGSDFLHGTTVNLLLDGYYEYNFNAPIGRVNLLRSYDVSSNAFSLNQADLLLENAPDPSHGKRFGARLDLQYGQATETLQGNSVNEPRPDVYRAIFQAFGTYVIPVGRGLNVDFGK
jgi:hypothetical protein